VNFVSQLKYEMVVLYIDQHNIDEVVNWIENLTSQPDVWWYSNRFLNFSWCEFSVIKNTKNLIDDHIIFGFTNKQDAILFKLTFK
jgi:hypothetical protein